MTPAPKTNPLQQRIGSELDTARRNGPLKRIVVPPCPALLVRLREAMACAEPDLTAVAQIASSDVAMSATLIQVANSAACSTGQPVRTIGQALNRLGLSQTATEMTSYLVRGAIPVRSPQLERFWERSAQRARMMGFIAERLPGMSPDLARTYGLFCHVGLPVMLQSLRGYAGTMVEAQARIDRSYVATENANHQTDHAVVGALVARVWQLAPEVMVAIRRHHDLNMLGDSQADPEVHTLVASGLLAEHLVRRHEGLDAEADWRSHGDQALAWLHLSADDVAQWEDELQLEADPA